MAGAGSSTTIQRLLPIRSARPRERFSDLLTMIDGKSMATLSYEYPWVFDLRARVLDELFCMDDFLFAARAGQARISSSEAM